MVSFRSFALLLALGSPAVPAVLAQSSSSSLSNPIQDPTVYLAQNAPSGEVQQVPGETQGELSVQERIRQRREQRRMTAIHDAYDHRWESYIDMGYLRFRPGPGLQPGAPLQRLTYYAWESGLTRFSTERLGYTLDARGYYGTAFVGLNQESQGYFTRPAISQYDLLVGPVYRFFLQPKYSISGRVMAGMAYGNFSGDTNGVPPQFIGLYPDGATYAATVNVIGEYNLTPNIAFKLVPEYFFTGFGSTTQASRGFTIGFAYRFGRQ